MIFYFDWYSGVFRPCQTSKMERFAKNAVKALNIFAKRFILDVWQGSEYVNGLKQYLYSESLVR